MTVGGITSGDSLAVFLMDCSAGKAMIYDV